MVQPPGAGFVRYVVLRCVQIDQLKEEILIKDHGLVKEHFDRRKVQREKELLEAELTRVKKQIQSSEHIIGNQEVEMAKLTKIIQVRRPLIACCSSLGNGSLSLSTVCALGRPGSGGGAAAAAEGV